MWRARFGGCGTSCGRWSSRCFLSILLTREAGAHVWMTVCASTRSCSCCSQGSRGGICRRRWAARQRPRTAGWRPGRPRRVGAAASRVAATVERGRTGSTGRLRLLMAVIFVRFWGAPYRPFAGRPCPRGLKASSDHRRWRDPARDYPDRRQPQRCHPAAALGRWGRASRRQAGCPRQRAERYSQTEAMTTISTAASSGSEE